MPDCHTGVLREVGAASLPICTGVSFVLVVPIMRCMCRYSFEYPSEWKKATVGKVRLTHALIRTQ